MKEIQRGFRSFRVFLIDRQNRKTVILIIASVALLTALSITRDMFRRTDYIVSDNGTVKGVIRNDAKESAEFPLRIEAEVEGRKEVRDVALTIEGSSDDKQEEKNDAADKKSLFEAELSELLLKLSKCGGEKVMLPSELPSGTGLTWRKGNDASWPFLLLLAPLMIWLIYMDGEKKKRDEIKRKTESVERELPAFNDQLLLLMGSGLIFRDAFKRIADGYRGKAESSYFRQVVIGIEDETEEGVADIVNVVTRSAEAVGVSQFSRLAGVIRDNQLMGTDISSKLKTEGEILWDLRKKNAEERGRLAETKLTLPLAILLMVLVAVTAAPAIIQVEGG